MKTLITRITQSSLAILTCLVAVPAAQAAYTTTAGTATPADAEAVTGGTFLNFQRAAEFPSGETRGGITITPVALGAAVANPVSPFGTVNWSGHDSSDGSRLVGGRHFEDNNVRNSTNVTSNPLGPPFVGASYNPFSVTLSGLVAGSLYNLKIVALGIREDTGGGQIPGLLDLNRPDIGVNSMDFSYGASAGSLTTFANTAAGTLIYEEKSGTAVVLGGVNYYSWKGAYACNIGNWLANGSGTITLFMGEGVQNLFSNGARTQLDGVAVTLVPEPSTLALLGLGGLGLALIRRRK